MSEPQRQDLHFQGTDCHGCGEVFPKSELDDHHWCPGCGPRLRRRMTLWRHGIALAITLPFGIWILQLERLEFLPQAAWLLPLGAAYYLGYRIGREVVKGYSRWRRTQ